MTSLDGPGFSITLLKASTELLEYIDAPTNAVGWSATSYPPSSWESETERIIEATSGTEDKEINTKGNIKCERNSVQLFQNTSLAN